MLRPSEAIYLIRLIKHLIERSARRVAWLAGHPTAAALAHSIERANAALDALAPEPKAAEPVPAAPAPREAPGGAWRSWSSSAAPTLRSRTSPDSSI